MRVFISSLMGWHFASLRDAARNRDRDAGIRVGEGRGLHSVPPQPPMTSEASLPINRICVPLQDSLALSLFILRWLMRSALIVRCSALSLNTLDVQLVSYR